MASESMWHLGQRKLLVEMVTKRGMSVTEAAALLEMSRKTAHKWLKRASASGIESGLQDVSRARKTQPRFEGEAVEKLLELRRAHPSWGPKHLLAQVRTRAPGLLLPSASTLTEIMRRAGMLTKKKRQRRHTPIFRQQRATRPNEVWTIDFKGQFRLGNGVKCYPLTLRDEFSRKVLRVDGYEGIGHEGVIETLESAFKEFGLPERLHSDTGAPFGSTGLGRLSQVSVYVMRLGIEPTFSRPAKPQDNGGHERMHLDLKQETALPPAYTMASQQKRLDDFVRCFNTERMHQALGMTTPDSVWKPSARRLPPKPKETKYDASWEVRGIDSTGKMSWGNETIFVAHTLRGSTVGLEPIDEGLWRLHFAGYPVAFFNEKSKKIEDIKPLPKPSRCRTLTTRHRSRNVATSPYRPFQVRAQQQKRKMASRRVVDLWKTKKPVSHKPTTSTTGDE